MSQDNNFLARRNFLQKKLLNTMVEVRPLGERDPKNVPNVDKYLPLPEYGVALWTYKV